MLVFSELEKIVYKNYTLDIKKKLYPESQYVYYWYIYLRVWRVFSFGQ